MVEALGLGFSAAEVQQLQYSLDKDFDGTVDMEEFVSTAPQLLQVSHCGLRMRRLLMSTQQHGAGHIRGAARGL